MVRYCMANLPFPGGFGLASRQLLTRVSLEWSYCAITATTATGYLMWPLMYFAAAAKSASPTKTSSQPGAVAGQTTSVWATTVGLLIVFFLTFHTWITVSP